VSTYPAAGDYYKAVQFPARSFTVPKLQAAEFVWDSLGPTLARGSSAVVFQAAMEGRPQALRCYIRDDASSRDRYGALNAYLARHDLSPYVSGANWLDGAIRVNQATWPVLTMEWVDGRTLNEYVDFLVTGSNAAALTTLAARWRELVALLQRSEFAHGDLQHGNVMVDQEGRIRLVDFDGVWIPQLAGNAPPTEFGHPNYQHPGPRPWDRWLDTFSALVIYLSLVALGKDPGLWLALNNSKNLLLAKSDFFPPFETEAWKQLAALGDPEVDDLIRRLQRCCSFDWVSGQSLEMTLDLEADQPVSSGQRWWRPKAASSEGPAPGAGSGDPPAHGIVPTASEVSSPSRGRPGAVVPAAASQTRIDLVLPAATAQAAAESLPAPPPLSAPLSTVGTGPTTQLRRTMAPAGETWWTGPSSPPGAYSPPGGPPHHGYGAVPQSPPGQYGQGSYGRAPQGLAPHGYPPQSQPPHRPAQPASRPPAPNSLLQNPIFGGIVLGLGIIFLIAGAGAHQVILVIIGLVAGAWGIWRLVTQAGSSTKPPRT
jgi:hypothetical protein